MFCGARCGRRLAPVGQWACSSGKVGRVARSPPALREAEYQEAEPFGCRTKAPPSPVTLWRRRPRPHSCTAAANLLFGGPVSDERSRRPDWTQHFERGRPQSVCSHLAPQEAPPASPGERRMSRGAGFSTRPRPKSSPRDWPRGAPAFWSLVGAA